MTIFITGGSKSGKSLLAQSMAKTMAGEGRLYYLATMEPRDDEDSARIAKHVEDRKGWGFETLECPRNVLSCLESADKSGVFLLDSVTALLSNEMFAPEQVRHDAAEKLAAELSALSEAVGGLVVVSDSIFSDAGDYGELTEEFRRGLADIACTLAKISDRAIEVCAGQTMELWQDTEEKGESALAALIVGGAYQGKTDYAMGRFGLEESDIFICSRESEPDITRRCLCHVERYARRCMETGVDGTKMLEEWFALHEDGVIIFDDVFCGVVPVDRELRAWREASGRLLGFAAKNAAEVTRVVCGLPQKLK